MRRLFVTLSIHKGEYFVCWSHMSNISNVINQLITLQVNAGILQERAFLLKFKVLLSIEDLRLYETCSIVSQQIYEDFEFDILKDPQVIYCIKVFVMEKLCITTRFMKMSLPFKGPARTFDPLSNVENVGLDRTIYLIDQS